MATTTLQMLTIMGFENEDCSGKPINTFRAQINPDTLNRSIKISAEVQQTKNKSGEKPATTTVSGESLSFDLILDGTGVIDDQGKDDISPLITKFQNTVMRTVKEEVKKGKTKEMQDVRKANTLKLCYCNLLFKCVISSASIKYSLFSTDGKPLRANINCEFKTVGEPSIPEKNEGESAESGSQTTAEEVAEKGVDQTVKDAQKSGKNSIIPKEQ